MLNNGVRVLVLVLVGSKVLVMVLVDVPVVAVAAVGLVAKDELVVAFVLDEVVLMVWLEVGENVRAGLDVEDIFVLLVQEDLAVLVLAGVLVALLDEGSVVVRDVVEDWPSYDDVVVVLSLEEVVVVVSVEEVVVELSPVVVAVTKPVSRLELELVVVVVDSELPPSPGRWLLWLSPGSLLESSDHFLLSSEEILVHSSSMSSSILRPLAPLLSLWMRGRIASANRVCAGDATITNPPSNPSSSILRVAGVASSADLAWWMLCLQCSSPPILPSSLTQEDP